MAVDLPGFGASAGVEVDREDVLVSLLDALGLERPVVVAPSMSGAFAFPLVERHPERVAGFVPVAPVGAEPYASRLEGRELPTLIFWGERDRVFPPAQGERLAKALRGSRLVVLEGAGHPCYLDQPEAFHRELLDFLGSL